MAIHLGSATELDIAVSSIRMPKRDTTVSISPIHLHLWEHRSLFLGVIPDHVELTSACAWLLAGLDTSFSIAINGGPRIRTRIALVPPGVEVCYFPEGGLQACCFLDVLCRDFRALSLRMQSVMDGLYYDEGTFADEVLVTFSRLYHGSVDPVGVYDCLVDALGLPSPTPEGHIQQTVADVVALVRSTAAANLTNSYYATEAGLAEEVLSRWFRQETGLSLRRYRNWHRLFLAALMMQQGVSLTVAAQEVGFSDAAHFNHVFREMLGLKPSFIQRAMAYTRIYYAGMLAVDGAALNKTQECCP
ncbi:MAG: helix-turn-helix domain-containing protein [Agitococcus sp.]|nr:helix-turn-helix domain-containing protein [Agitococcus sp.]